jgi:hypothetical protein
MLVVTMLMLDDRRAEERISAFSISISGGG